MSLGLPNFNFIFQSKGVSAIERSARGIVAVILKDDTEGEEQNVYNKVDDVDFTQWTEDNYNYLKLIYEGAPSKVIAMRVATNVESYNAVLKKLKDLKWNYLCIPGIKAADTTMIGAWIKQYRNDEKKTFKVVLPHYAGDHGNYQLCHREHYLICYREKAYCSGILCANRRNPCWTVSFQKQYLLCFERCFFGRSAG